jgi:lipopolysaccharide biosynthesis glycosyltransferase
VSEEQSGYNKHFDNLDPLKSVHKDFIIEYVNVSQKIIDELPEISGRLPKEVNLKLFLGDLLPINNEKLLYLDSDTIIKDDISKLINKDMSSHTIAGAQDVSPESIVGLGASLDRRYINAGVLLINLERWRDQNVKKKCFEFIKTHNPNRNEQTALNAILHQIDSIDVVSLTYNFHPSWHYGEGNIELKSKLKIIHYWGPSARPWHFENSENEYTEIWLNYYKETPFSNFYPKYRYPKLLVWIKKRLEGIPVVSSIPRCLYKCLDCFAN